MSTWALSQFAIDFSCAKFEIINAAQSRSKVPNAYGTYNLRNNSQFVQLLQYFGNYDRYRISGWWSANLKLIINC